MTVMDLIMKAWSGSEIYFLSGKVRNTEHVMHMFELYMQIWQTNCEIRPFNELIWSKRSWLQFRLQYNLLTPLVGETF